MISHVAVSDPLPLYRRGVMATLNDAGFACEAPDDLTVWIREEWHRIVFLTLLSRDDWLTLQKLHRARSDLLIVSALQDMNTAEHVRALTAGAVAVVPRHALPATVREVFEAALHSRCILPVDVLRALAAASPSTTLQPDIVPSPQELEWLRQMADGRTVARLAASVGYSDRMMFRLLRNLYDRLNVKGRTDALVLARTMGWI